MQQRKFGQWQSGGQSGYDYLVYADAYECRLIYLHLLGKICNFAAAMVDKRMRQTVAAAISLVALLYAPYTAAQQSGREAPEPTKKERVIEPSYAWKMLEPLGLREEADMDTLFEGYAHTSLPSGISDAYTCTGNYGAEGLNMVFSERPAMSDFYFRDAVEHWLPSFGKHKFFNSRIPMTQLGFTTAGGKETSQELLTTRFSGNISKRGQVGAMLDYLYSKGAYANQATKDLNWGFSGSYLGDRYEFQGFFYHYNLLAKENGGITDMLYIEDPAELQGGVSTIDAKSIPTNLSYAHNRFKGMEICLNNRYKVGYWHEDVVDDTTVVRTYVPVTSFVYTFDYTDAKHLFIDESPTEMEKYWGRSYLNSDITRDITSYSKVTNTVGVSLLEGFHKYAKFGLAAYITHQVRRYTLTADTLDRSNPEEIGLTPWPDDVPEIARKTTDQLAYVGGQLTKMRGAKLRYDATFELGILGPVAGDIRAIGNVYTRFPLFGDSLRISAYGKFTNEEAPYLTKRYYSNHFIWYNDFGKRRTLQVGGNVAYPRTGTAFALTVSNLQNYIYFDASGMPQQHGGSIRVLSMTLNQNFRVGNLHWDNRVTYQTTDNDEVIPLPKVVVYSNLYLQTHIATLRFQLGVDCSYYTSYYAPSYQPATVAFVNQRDIKIGNYPYCTVYANMKLSKTRFYVMYSHFNKGLFGGSEYFSMPYYPLNPSRLQLGLCVDFLN